MSQLHDALSNRYDLNQDMRRQRILESLHTEDFDLMPDEEDQPMTDTEFAALNAAGDAAHAAEVKIAGRAEMKAAIEAILEFLQDCAVVPISRIDRYNQIIMALQFSIRNRWYSQPAPAQPVTGEAAVIDAMQTDADRIAANFNARHANDGMQAILDRARAAGNRDAATNNRWKIEGGQ